MKHVVEGYDFGGIDFPTIGWGEGDDHRTGMDVPEVKSGRVNVGSYGLMSMSFDLGKTSVWSRDKLVLGGVGEGSRGKDWPGRN